MHRKVIISEFMDEAVLGSFDTAYEVIYDPALVDNRPRLLAMLGGAQGLVVRNRTQVDPELLAAAPHLKVVGRLGVGLDNIDIAACKARAIAVCPATGANAASVAEYVIASALILIRGAFYANGQMTAGAWPRGALMGGEIGGRTLGLWGYGSIAREVAKRAKALGMRVTAHDPFLPAEADAWRDVTRCAEPAALLSTSDVLSLHVPLTDATRGLIDVAALAAMKRSAIVINTARGGVVDEEALVAALKSGRLGGAALDVFDTEPLTTDVAARFEGVPNLILTPHIAGVTVEGNQRVSEITVRNVMQVLSAT